MSIIPEKVWLDSIEVVGETVSGWTEKTDHVTVIEYIRADLADNLLVIPEEIQSAIRRLANFAIEVANDDEETDVEEYGELADLQEIVYMYLNTHSEYKD